MSSVMQSLINKRAFRKRAFVPMTDPAMQAGMGAPPMDPSAGGMPPQGMPPQGGAPMDPSMGGMPPQGAPMPPQGGTGDPVVDQLLAMGYQIDQQGNVYGPDGQPVPPEQLQQLAQQIAAQMGGGMPPQGGAPMEPSMGGQPPMDPGMMDPSMQGQPPTDPNMAPPPEADPMAMMADMINTILDERMSNLDKRISAITDKLDTVRSLLEDILDAKDGKDSKAMANEADQEISNILATPADGEAVPPPQMIAPERAQGVPQSAEEQMDLLAALGGQQ